MGVSLRSFLWPLVCSCAPILFFQTPVNEGPQAGMRVNKRALVASSSSQTDVPTFSAYGPAQCDSAGNLYFHVGAELGSYNSGVIMRLSRDTNQPTLFKASSDSASKLAFMEFSVTPSGTAWLLEKNHGKYEVFGFQPDRDTPNHVALEAPDHMEATDFVAAEDAILLGGYYDESAPEESKGKSFLALFNRAGQIVKDFSSQIPGSVKLTEVRKNAHDGAGAVGPDGNFYFVSGNEMMVLSGGGEVVRRIPVEKPEESLAARLVKVTGDLISIQYDKIDKDGAIHVRFLVLSAATGEPYWLYTPSEELGNNCVCFSRASGYTFLRVEKGKLKFLTAPLS